MLFQIALRLQRNGNFLLDEKHSLIFCYVPKNACSVWKRIWSILQGTSSESTVFNLSSVDIHLHPTFHSPLGHTSLLQQGCRLQTFKKIMFARDPYERLFSGYMDKFFTPCNMVPLETKVTKLIRGVTDECQPGVSFTEFLEYVTNNHSVKVNPHFGKQSLICLPCQMDYDYIGKLETFRQDAEHILKEVVHIDPSEVFGDRESFEQNSDLNIIFDVSKEAYSRSQFCRCVSHYSILRRLWMVFQVGRFHLSV